MSLHYLVNHAVAICGTWKRYFCNFGDVNRTVASKFPRPESSRLQDIVADAGPRLPDRNMMSTSTKIAVWADMKQSVINKVIDEWRSRLAACVRAKGRHFEHLLCWTWALCFVACLIVCQGTLLASPKLRNNALCPTNSNFMFYKVVQRHYLGEVKQYLGPTGISFCDKFIQDNMCQIL